MAADAPRFRKRIVDITIPAGQTSKAVNVGLGGLKYARLVSIFAKITTGSDATTILQLADTKGIVFLDAAAKDYTGAGLRRIPVQDETRTGLTSYTYVDSTGAALAGTNMVLPQPVLEGPLTLTWSSATAGETLRVELLLEV